jgi:uncharacterized repeat protein (TIGR01451 family)
MTYWQPTASTKAKGQGKRKLVSALLASALLWLPMNSANAVILNTVTATGTENGVTDTASASASVDVENANPKISVIKTAVLNDGGDGSADPGDSISFAFTITNTGNITLQNVALTDTNAVLTGAPIALMAPGDINTLAYTATHVLTAADIVAGLYVNTAIASAHALSGQDITGQGVSSTPLAVLSSMQLVKSGVLDMGTNGRADPGDKITYTFNVTNTGPSPLHDVKISDPLVNLASLPGQDMMVAMLDAGRLQGDPITTASINSTAPIEMHFAAADQYVENLAPPRDVPQVTTDLNALRRIVRMSGDGADLAAGDKIGFVYALTNSGEGPLTNIKVIQPDADAYGDGLELLAANTSDSANIIFTRAITATEVANGEINAPAAVTAKSRDQYIARNLPAKITLSSITSFDNFASATITPSVVTTLNKGASTSFSAIYTLTQADIDRGFVDNTATATALNAANQTLTSISSFHQSIVPVPDLAIIKTGQVNLGADGIATVGDIVTYHFAITNLGNVTLNAVNIIDTNAMVTGSPITPLAPGATNTTAYTATHTLTQLDIDAGKVSNQAHGEGTSPTGTIVNKPSDNDKVTEADPTIVSLAPAPKIGLLKTVFQVSDINNNGMTDVGDTITYHFSVTNTGNQTLTNILVTDPLVAVGDSNGNLPAVPLATLAPGQTDGTYFSSVYTIIQTDVDRGEVDNTAKAEGTAPGNVQVIDYSDPGVLTQDSPTKSIIPPQPVITLIKLENGITDTNNNTLIDAGDVIHYTFKVENLGNVTLSNIRIIDNLAGATVQGAPLPSLSPLTFDATHFTAAYTITQADVTAGRVSNQAVARGTPPTGADTSDLSDNAAPNFDNPTITAITPLPSIALIKTIKSIIDTNANGATDAGDTINYTFTIKNSGNMPLNAVSVTDASATVSGTTIATLPAGNTNATSFTASHVITAADITAGQFANRAKVQGTTTTNTTVYDDSDNNSFTENDFTVTYFANAPSVAILKSVASTTDANNNGLLDTGDTINYKFDVINNGNVVLTGLTVTDNNGIVSGGPLASLAPNNVDQTTFTATHLITPADFLAGNVTNQATVHAHTILLPNELVDLSDSASVTGNAPTVTPLAAVPGIALIKTVKSIEDKNLNGLTDIGDVITYAFDIVNTGNVDLTNVVLTDANATIIPASATLASLPKATHNNTTFTATHEVVTADAIADQVSNSASVIAQTPTGGSVSDTSDRASITGDAPTITPVKQPPPSFTKTANKTEVKRGESVTYTITASNLIGPSYSITDIMPPEFGFVAGSATVNNVAVAVTPVGRELNFPTIAPVAGRITIKLKLLASTTLAGGKFINNANLFSDASGALIAKAQAAVTISIEPVFDCSDIIGHVFDDENSNGYMDDGEAGLPGVRIATLNGLLITTDSEGRYHVPCAAVPDAKIGSNYLLKLDPRTLPTGYKLTTENPRDVRVTRGKMVKLNFGATISHNVKLDLNDDAFEKGSADLKEKWIAGVDRLIEILAKKHAPLVIIYHNDGHSDSLAQARLDAVSETITFAWENSNQDFDLNVTTSVEAVK